MQFDYVVVGGGSAGCVLANRLSASSGNRVLLCEAGPDFTEDQMPADLEDTYVGLGFINPNYHWPNLNVTTECPPNPITGENDARRRRKYIQPRVLGGGSSINGQAANRGAPSDYAEWEELGAKGWDWESVLPYFKKLEIDLDFGGPLHGNGGPISIRRIPREHWTGHAKAAAAAFEQAGYPYLPDQNGEYCDGYFAMAIANRNEKRVSAATAYLNESVRSRTNLKVLTNAQVVKLRFSGKRCIGVDVQIDGKVETVGAGEVILSSGAIYSPTQLLRAGIGPAAHLRQLGIEVLADRPGVGQRLMDHPAVALGCFLKPESRMNKHTRRHMQVGLRYSSDIGDRPGDMSIGVVSRTAWHAVGSQMGAMAILVNRTFSDRGEIRLSSTNPADAPVVDFNLLADRRDAERLMDGFRRMAAIHARAPLKAACHELFPASYSDRVIQYGVVNTTNKLKTEIARWLLDGPASIRKFLINKVVVDQFDLADILTNESRLEEFVRKTAIGAWHACCSARMGHKDDPMAVTDEAGRVYGVTGLRVVDASIFPIPPRANTNIPTIMCAEKISDMILNNTKSASMA